MAEKQPRFKFDRDENLESTPDSHSETRDSGRPAFKSPKEEHVAMCGECDLALGTGNCTRCVRIKNQRGNTDLEPAPKATRLVDRSGYFRQRRLPDKNLNEVKAKVARDVADHKAKKILFEKVHRQLSPEEKEELRLMQTQQQRDDFIRRKDEEYKSKTT